MWMHFYFSATGKHRIYFQIYSFMFLFYLFHLKCSSFLTRKIKSTKFKEGLGYFSLVILSSLSYSTLPSAAFGQSFSRKQTKTNIWGRNLTLIMWSKESNFLKWIFVLVVLIVTGVFVFVWVVFVFFFY